MTWPTGNVPTTHLDSGTDDPNQAKDDLKALIDKFNQLMNHPSTDGKQLIAATDFAAMRSLLSLVVGTDVASQAGLDAAESDITALDGRVTTNEGDITALETSRKPTALDHGTKSGNFTLDLSGADLHIIAFSAAATLTISSSLTNDRATVVIKNNNNAITLAGIDNNSPTPTQAASTQDMIGLIKSFGKMTAVATVLNQPTS